jgi:hypothetical protein
VPNSSLNVYICNDSIARCQALSTQSLSEVSNYLQEHAIRYGCEPNHFRGRHLLVHGEVPPTDQEAMSPSSKTPSASSLTQSSIPSVSSHFMDVTLAPPSHALVPPSTRSIHKEGGIKSGQNPLFVAAALLCKHKESMKKNPGWSRILIQTKLQSII